MGIFTCTATDGPRVSPLKNSTAFILTASDVPRSMISAATSTALALCRLKSRSAAWMYAISIASSSSWTAGRFMALNHPASLRPARRQASTMVSPLSTLRLIAARSLGDMRAATGSFAAPGAVLLGLVALSMRARCIAEAWRDMHEAFRPCAFFSLFLLTCAAVGFIQCLTGPEPGRPARSKVRC